MEADRKNYLCDQIRMQCQWNEFLRLQESKRSKQQSKFPFHLRTDLFDFLEQVKEKEEQSSLTGHV